MRPDQEKYIIEHQRRKSPQEIASALGIRARHVKKFLAQIKKSPSPELAPKNLMSRRSFIWLFVLFLVLGLSIYANVIPGGFVWDDEHVVQENLFIRGPGYLGEIFTQSLGQGADEKSYFYRPIQLLTYMIDFSFWGLNPIGYHLTNIFLHVVVSLFIFWMLNFFFGDRRLAFVTSLLFLAHPVHTEVVSYISGRADALAVLFMGLAFWAYLRILQEEKKNIVWYLVMLSAYAAALLSRENSFILLLIVLIYHALMRKKISGPAFLCLMALGTAYGIVRLNAFPLPPSTATFGERLPGFFAALIQYLRLLVWPVGLHMEYGYPLFSFGQPLVLAGMVVFGFLLFILVCKRRDKLIFFAVLWFLMMLLPATNIVALNAYMAEHWLYLPSIAFFIVLAQGLLKVYEQRRVLGVSLFVVIFLFYSFLTIQQNTYWQDPITFYERTLRYAPSSARLYNNLGKAYAGRGYKEKAISFYKKAMELAPGDALAYNNLANTYGDLGRDDEAIELFEKALGLDQDHADKYYNNLAATYAAMGKNKEAVQALEKALEINPRLAGAYFNLGMLYERLGDEKKSEASFSRAIELNEDFRQAYEQYRSQGKKDVLKSSVSELSLTEAQKNNQIGFEYAQKGRFREAIDAFQKALQDLPCFADALCNLGNVYSSQGEVEKAISFYKKAIDCAPDYALAYYNLGKLYEDVRRWNESFSAYGRAVEFRPDFKEAHLGQVRLYLKQGECQAARRKAAEMKKEGMPPGPEWQAILDACQEKR